MDGTTSEIQPDILVIIPGSGSIVLDAKWKRPNGRPAEADLRQLYAYAQYYDAKQTLLLYPHTATEQATTGYFVPSNPKEASRADALGHNASTTSNDSVDEQVPAEAVMCSTAFVRVGKCNDASEDGYTQAFNADGYLHCSLVSLLDTWIVPSIV